LCRLAIKEYITKLQQEEEQKKETKRETKMFIVEIALGAI
jgi:hypothetical protein